MFSIFLDLAFAPFSIDWFQNDLVLIPAGILLFCFGFSFIRRLINLFWSR